jgi:hypothetical protein
MSKILRLDPTYDLWLTYSWSGNNHGICGHTFEVIDYFHILKDHFAVGILLCEDITIDVVHAAIVNKYAFTDDEVAFILSRVVIHNRPRLVSGRNILFVDGGVVNTSSVTLIFDHIFYFACGNKEVKDNTNPNVVILQDDRVYAPVKLNGVNYKKRILFSKLKPCGEADDNILVYATKNCRAIADFDELLAYGRPIIAITNQENIPPPVGGVTFLLPPVGGLFDRFTTYLYTPVSRKWDCSPRFIAECKHYGKDVIYHKIDYWDVDHGLYWRKWDIDNDFSSLHLTETDDIIRILSEYVIH